jgi:glutamyl-tRNA synthetase
MVLFCEVTTERNVMSVRVRFAPSPTGQVHIGNIRAAIFNWLFARHEQGKFLLRIEDTDRERSTAAALQTVLDSMEWLGLNFDEPPMYQSTRTAAHLAAAEVLLSKGLAYKQDKGGTGKGECVIFRMPGTDIEYHDLVKGDLSKAAKDLQDFVIVRSDGTPVFHLANVSDDIEMNITHIIRGDDHVENTFKHIALFRAIGAEPPKYGHLPMIVNQHGKPYSKRDGAAFVGDFREQGFLAQTLFNYLSLLGWSPGDDREKLSRDELIAAFTLDRVRSGPSQMDIRKLTHLNSRYVAELPPDIFEQEIARCLAEEPWFTSADPAYVRRVEALMQSRTHLFNYSKDWVYFFSDEFPVDAKSAEKLLRQPGRADTLARLREAVETITFDEAGIEKAIREVEKAAGIQEGKLNQPLRIALTGISRGAGLYETMALIGKDRCCSRLERAKAAYC